MSTITSKQRRPRIQFGQLVASTNAIQHACAKSITIVHAYNPINYNRVRRFVLNT